MEVSRGPTTDDRRRGGSAVRVWSQCLVMVGLWRETECEPGRKPATRPRLKLDPPTIGLRQLPHDREPQPSSPINGAARGIAAVEGLEHGLDLVSRNAGTPVEYADAHGGLRSFQQQVDGLATAVAKGIVQQIFQHAAQGQGRQVQRPAFGRRVVAHPAGWLIRR